MIEKINTPSKTPEKAPNLKDIEVLETFFAAAESALEYEDREKAKSFLDTIYKGLQQLNGSNRSDWKKVWDWNPKGDLTETQFNELNLRRKKLSNAIGIMTASGVRHDLNEI